MKLIYLLLLPHMVMGQVWVKYPTSIKKNDKLSYASSELKKDTSYKVENTLLKDKLRRAQDIYFNNPRADKVIESFKQLIEIRFERPWRRNHRRVFYYGFGRLAQFDHEKKRFWLEQAILYDRELELDRDIFPPNLLEMYDELKSSMNSKFIEWDLSKDYPFSEFVVVNGKIYDTKKTNKILLSPYKTRIDIYFNTQFTIYHQGSSVDFLISPPVGKQILLGSCTKPQIHKEFTELSFVAHYGKSCSISFPVQKYLETKNELPEKNKKQPNLDLQPKLPLEVVATNAFTSAPPEEKKNITWPYWVAGILVGVLIYNSHKKGSRNEEPEQSPSIIINDD